MTTRPCHGIPVTANVGTDVGKVRSNNEDSYGLAWASDSSLLLVVADGMGGHEAGEVASNLAVRVIEDEVANNVGTDPRDTLYNALLEANRAILEEGTTSGTRGMGTTAICAYVQGYDVYVAQVGDSRCYHIRSGHPIFRTTDHTRVQMLVEEGKIAPDQARFHPEAGMLTRALGHAKMADGRPLVPEVFDDPIRMQDGDSLILCSDGLHDLLSDDEIAIMAAGKLGSEAINDLIQAACERGGHDNITVATLSYGSQFAPRDENFILLDASEDQASFAEDLTFEISRDSVDIPPPDIRESHHQTIPPPMHQTGRFEVPVIDEPEGGKSNVMLFVAIGLVAAFVLFSVVICLVVVLVSQV